ncbi:MAG: YSC84-related protein [Nitrospirota bacterium]|nr:YSC84-related protein [Nitrospirota bacterium]MDH5586373.1 YSC84-related protein [Nitrospirota bacterium]MDH5774913.1 YSC84-related protein [Nitrospirota bacterium]
MLSYFSVTFLRTPRAFFLGACSLFVLGAILFHSVQPTHAATAREIDVSVDVALEKFHEHVKGGEEFLKTAKGVLVFPRVLKAGFGFGGEYGEGALRIDGKTVDYYNTAAASFGLQFGAQAKTIVLVFVQQESLDDFRNSSGWEVGADGSVALVTVGAGGSIDSTNIKDPILAFVFGQKGLMYNLTLEGSKYTKLDKKKED